MNDRTLHRSANGPPSASVRARAGLLLFLVWAMPCLAWIDFRGPIPDNFKRHFAEYEYDRIWRTLAPRRAINHATLTVICYLSSTAEGARAARLLPEWGGGGALGPDTILLPVDRHPLLGRDAFQTLSHEMVHCVFARAYPRARPPRWFAEGVAMTLAGELDFGEQIELSKATIAGRLMPLGAIDSVNAFGASRARLAYAQSHAAVAILIEHYGLDGVAALLGRAERTHDFWRAFKDEIGLDEKEFGAMAGSLTRSRYALMFLFGDPYIFWLVAVVLFIIGGSITLWRFAAQRRMMEVLESESGEEEIPVDENRPYEGPLPEGMERLPGPWAAPPPQAPPPHTEAPKEGPGPRA